MTVTEEHCALFCVEASVDYRCSEALSDFTSSQDYVRVDKQDLTETGWAG